MLRHGFHASIASDPAIVDPCLYNFLVRQFKREGLEPVRNGEVYDKGMQIIASFRLTTNERGRAENALRKYLGIPYNGKVKV